MNRFSLYILLIMLYLGLSKSFAPSEQKADYIQNEQVLSVYFKGAPIAVLMTDTIQAGFLIKTYYLKLKIINPFESYSEDVVVRTSAQFWEKNTGHIGMTIFRRKEDNAEYSTLPLPPGAQYIGDPAYGSWAYEDSGKKVWQFHKAYRRLYQEFYWGNFRPDFEFYEKLGIYLNNGTIFYGLNEEFGTNGSVTKENLLLNRAKNSDDLSTKHFKDFIKKYWLLPNQFKIGRGNS